MSKHASKGNTGAGHEIADNLPVTVTTVNGKQFVSGLLWEKLDRLRGFMAEARLRGRELGMDIVAIRQLELAAQAGFAPHRAGASKGHYSMAVVLAEQYGQDFVAALHIEEDRYVFVACSEGIILPKCDVVLGRVEAEAKVGTFAAQLRRMIGAGRERGSGRTLRLIAPAEFGVPGAEERSLSDDLDPKQLKRHHQLKPLAFGLSAKERRQSAVAFIALSLLLGGSYYIWQAYTARTQSDSQERQRAEAALKAKRLAGIQQGPSAPANIPKLPHPWLREPPVPVFVETCSIQMGKLPPLLVGWGLVGVECTYGRLSVSYQRDPAGLASLADFQDALKASIGVAPKLAVADDGNTISFGVGFATAEYHVDDSPAPPSAPTILAARSYFQRAGIAASFAKSTPPAAQAGSQAGDKPAPVQDWMTYTLAVNDMAWPAFLLRDLDMPTVRLTSISETFNPLTTEQSWSVKGAVYVAQ